MILRYLKSTAIHLKYFTPSPLDVHSVDSKDTETQVYSRHRMRTAPVHVYKSAHVHMHNPVARVKLAPSCG